MILEEKIHYINLPNYTPNEYTSIHFLNTENCISINQNNTILWRKNYDLDILNIVDSFHNKINCSFTIMYHLNETKLKERMYLCKPILYRHNFFELLAYNNRFARFRNTHIVRNFEEFLDEIPVLSKVDVIDTFVQTERQLPLVCSRPTPTCIEIEDFVFNLTDKIVYNKNIHHSISDDENMYMKKEISGSIIYIEPGMNILPDVIKGTLQDYKILDRSTKTNKLISQATCIITPYHKVDYWVSTIKNMHQLDLDVFKIKSKQDWVKTKYQDLLKASFVVISKELLEDKGPMYNQLMKWNATNSYFYSEVDVDKAFTIYLEEFICYKNSLMSSKPLLQAIHWHRVIFDEYHIHKYFKLGWIYKNLTSTMRWFLSSCVLLSNNSIHTTVLEKFFSSDSGIDFMFLFKDSLQKVIHRVKSDKPEDITYISVSRNHHENTNGYSINRQQDVLLRNIVSIYKPRTNISSYVSIINTETDLKQILQRDAIATSSFLETINLKDNFCFLCQDSKQDIIWLSCGHLVCEECLESWVNQLMTDRTIIAVKQVFCSFCKQKDVNMYTLNNRSIELHAKPRALMDLINRCLGKIIVICLDSRIAMQLKNFSTSTPSFILDGSVYRRNVAFKNWVESETGILYLSHLDDICGLDDFDLDHVIFYDGKIEIYNNYFKNAFNAKQYILST